MKISTSIHASAGQEYAQQDDGKQSRIFAICRAVQDSYGVPYDMCRFACFSAINSAVRGKVAIRVNDDWIEPANAFFVLCAESGAGKSPVNAFFKEPLLTFQQQWNESHSGEILQNKARALGNKKRIRALERQIEKQKDQAQFDKIVAEISALQRMSQVSALRTRGLEIFVDDITNKSLLEVMAQQGGRVAVMEAEASLFRHFVNAKPLSPIVDTLLKAFSGEPVQLKRSGEDMLVIEQPSLAMNVMVQPAVLEELGRNKAIIGRGLFGRILFCVCNPQPKYRGLAQIQSDLKAEYAETIHAILDHVESSKGRIVLSMDSEASSEWNCFVRSFEGLHKGMGDAGEVIWEWCGKAAKHVLHLAAFIHMFESKGRWETIDRKSMSLAIQCARGFYSALLHALEIIFPESGVKLANKMLQCWVPIFELPFTARDVQRTFGVELVRTANQAIDWLLRRGLIFPFLMSAQSGKVGRKHSQQYLVVRDAWFAARNNLRNS
jgi:hypothetical protein